ncbi:MAG: hypothetical protein WBK61_07415 [Bacillota bacterium]
MSIILLVTVMACIGILPQLLLQTWPALSAVAVDIYGAETVLTGFSFWSWHDVLAALVTLGVGIAVAWLGLRTGLFHWSCPRWLTLEGILRGVYASLAAAFCAIENMYCALADYLSKRCMDASRVFLTACNSLGYSRGVTIGGKSLSVTSTYVGLVMIILLILVVRYTCLEIIQGAVYRLTFTCIP